MLKTLYTKGSIGRAFAVPMRTEHLDQASFCPFAPREVSVLAELALGHLRYSLTDVPPQSNSPPGSVLEPDHAGVVRRRALPPRRHSARLERNTVRPPIKSTAHRFRPTDDDRANDLPLMLHLSCLLKRVIVTPAVYPRLLEFLHVDIQSTGQKSHCVNTREGHRNALF
ncbi:unnamed protein product [Parnassius mnemosyne]|uniref:Uncharacterized protein n=1 Tax=Parnassius mnemosyne TaxID=213953 RepID=A0AAV1M022_9NEOP